MSIMRARAAHPAHGADRPRRRGRSTRPLRRIAAALMSVALGLGIALVGVAAPASAHHATVDGSFECNPTTGLFDITWTVKNSQSNKVAEVTKSSNRDVVAVGHKIGKGETDSFEQRGVSAGRYTLEVELDWKGAEPDSDKRTVNVTGECGGGSGNDQVCDDLDTGHLSADDRKTYPITAPEGKLIAEVCVKAGSKKQGNGPEYTTLPTPSKTYTISHSSGKDISHYSVRYVDDEFDWNWEYPAPTCKALTVTYPANIPAGQAIDVNIRIIADGEQITLNFRQKDGAAYTGKTVFEYAKHADWPDPDTWTVVWVQVAGTNYHWTGSVQCGDGVTICHYDKKSSSYEKETISTKAFFRGEHDEHAKDIYPSFTYTDWWLFVPVQKTQPANGDQSLLQYPDCVKPPTELPAPAAPAFSDTCGPDNEVFTEPADTDSLDWTTTYGPSSITVTVAAKDGFRLPADAQTTWTFPVDDAPCPPTVVPVNGEPTFDDSCHPGDDEVTTPGNTDALTWSKVKDGDVWTVTVAANTGFALPENVQTVWTFTANEGPCFIELEGAPTFADSCGPANEQLTVPADTEEVDWSQSRSGDVITVTAAPKTDYAFSGEPTTVWEFTVDDSLCVIEVKDAPTYVDECGVGNGQLHVPADTDTVDWESTIENGIVTVTATAVAGSTFPEGTTATWTWSVNDEPCLTELTGEPSFTDTCGPQNEELVVPDDTEQVDWESTREGDVITVTATPKADWAFSGEPQTVWTYEVDDTDCAVPTLDGSVATGECRADVPWIGYRVVLTDPDAQATSRTVFLILSDGENSERIELGDLNDEGMLEGRTLWPGASVDEQGNPTGWPGWEQLADGTWVETEGNYAWTRDITTATFEVNPDLTVDLAYPPATPNCATGPELPGGDGSTPAASGGNGLASTGFAGGTIAIIAGVIVVLGAAVVVIATIRRKRAAAATKGDSGTTE